MRRIVIGVMGPGEQATTSNIESAYQLGELIADSGWVLLTGGRKTGVMDAACRGAKTRGGLTVGILPNHSETDVSPSVDLAIFTDMGNARNQINVLSANVIVACGIGLGTISEIALALKIGKTVILLETHPSAEALFTSLAPNQVFKSDRPLTAIKLIKLALNDHIQSY